VVKGFYAGVSHMYSSLDIISATQVNTGSEICKESMMSAWLFKMETVKGILVTSQKAWCNEFENPGLISRPKIEKYGMLNSFVKCGIAAVPHSLRIQPSHIPS